MNPLAAIFDHPLLREVPWRSLGVPLLIFMVLAMMIIPLPPFLLDLCFTFNIALALVVMMAAAYTRRPLDFATFPTVLLLTTLMRLSLNVASTRAVLMQGHAGPSAAGKVIESFGHFVIGGNFAVGLIVFSILVVINFVVVTKGAGRIAEVAARFTLDAMPGKQMAIDADLNTGAIDDKEARRRRTEISQEADFYGAMDGAIKFVLGVIPGMPWMVFLLLAAACGYAARRLWQRDHRALQAQAQAAAAPAEPPSQEASWDDIVPVDVLGLEVGYRLIPLVDQNADGELLKRIKAIRKKFAQDIGFLPPPVHIRDNLELKPSQYRMLLKGVVIGEGEAFNGMWLAINPGGVTQSVPGTPTRDPAFGLPAIWIEARTRESAQALGYHVGKLQPKMVEDLVPKLVPLGTLQKVLSNLLEEGVHIRDTRTIIETLADAATSTADPLELTARVRAALR